MLSPVCFSVSALLLKPLKNKDKRRHCRQRNFYRLSALTVVILLLFSSAGQRVDPAYVVLRALSRAYAPQIGKPSFWSRLNDWGFEINGTLFGWAHGRILPNDLTQDYEKYRKFGVYYYPKDLPPIPPFNAEKEKEFLAELARNSTGLAVQESNAFRQALYQAPDKQAMDELLHEISFMEFRVKVHPIIIWPLKRVENRLINARRQDAQLNNFFRSLRNISSYSWRKIQYFEKLSNHSFGTALDFLPQSWEGKATYWNWERDYRKDWYNLPYKQRWSPPQALIKAFESEGFIWGGKWLYFDSMHFEYRPELYLLRHYLARPR